MIILEPTVEFEPWDWAGDKAHDIIGTTEWDAFWDDFLKTIGMKPIYSGSWLISVDEINEPEIIKKIIALTCKGDFSLENTDNDFIVLNGGYRLSEDNKVLFGPTCCCDLGDLRYWKELISLDAENWHNLLMGHARMYARKMGDYIEIKEIPEYGNAEPILEIVNKNELLIAIAKAEQKINLFQKKIAPIVDEMFINQELSEKISKKLIGQQ